MHWRFCKIDQQSLGTTNRGKLALLEISFMTGKVTATGLLNYHWVVKRYLVHSWQGFLSQSVATFISNLRFFTINKKDFMEWVPDRVVKLTLTHICGLDHCCVLTL